MYAGDGKSEDQIFEDSTAILVMFDLTSSCTLSRYLNYVALNFIL